MFLRRLFFVRFYWARKYSVFGSVCRDWDTLNATEKTRYICHVPPIVGPMKDEHWTRTEMYTKCSIWMRDLGLHSIYKIIWWFTTFCLCVAVPRPLDASRVRRAAARMGLCVRVTVRSLRCWAVRERMRGVYKWKSAPTPHFFIAIATLWHHRFHWVRAVERWPASSRQVNQNK